RRAVLIASKGTLFLGDSPTGSINKTHDGHLAFSAIGKLRADTWCGRDRQERGKVNMRKILLLLVLVSSWAGFTRGVAKDAAKHQHGSAEAAVESSDAILWQEPKDIALRDLFYGSGGSAHAPDASALKFVKESLNGTAPKFDVVDAHGV